MTNGRNWNVNRGNCSDEAIVCYANGGIVLK